MNHCVVCKKPLGVNATAKGKKACKKHNHILLSHFDENEIPGLKSIGYLTQEAVEKPIENLGDYQEAMLNGLGGFLMVHTND